MAPCVAVVVPCAAVVEPSEVAVEIEPGPHRRSNSPAWRPSFLPSGQHIDWLSRVLASSQSLGRDGGLLEDSAARLAVLFRALTEFRHREFGVTRQLLCIVGSQDELGNRALDLIHIKRLGHLDVHAGHHHAR